MILPKPSLMDTIQVVSAEHPYPGSREKPGTITRSWLRSLTCLHAPENLLQYVRIDHRAGPGSFADNFSGHVCCNCGEVFGEHPV